MNKKKSILECNVLYTIIAIIIGFLVGAIFLTIAGISPAVAYGKLFSSIFSKPKYLVWTLVYAAPLIFTGLSVAFSFRTGVFNIGAEGQFVIGGLVACILGIVLKLPAGIHAIVGVLKVNRGIHEVLSFIMFNWIAFDLSNYMVNLPFIHRDKTEATQDIAASARLLLPEGMRNALGCTSAHWGFVLAVVAAIVIWIIIEKTTLGYKLKAVGFNSSAAEYGGIDANRSILTALGISGLLSGLGGAVQVLGLSGRLSQFAGQEGFGFEGITVALIGSSNPIGCIFSGLFYGAMKYGGSKLSIVKAPSEVVDIIMGCVVLLIAIAHVFKYFVLKTAKKKEAK